MSTLSLRTFVRLAGGLFVATTIPTSLRAADTISVAAASSQPYVWRNVAIQGGGFVSGLVFHPAQPDLLYARTDVAGAFRWESTQQHWLPLNDALDADDAQLLGIVSLALDPADAERVYLACGSYLWPAAQSAAILHSTDRGRTWGRTPLPFKLGGNQDGRSTGERLQVDPLDARVLLLGTNQDGLWRSGDRALTWRRMENFPAPSVTFVLFDPRGGAPGQPTPAIFAGVNNLHGAALLRSRDAGKTWSAVPGQPAGLIPHHAALGADGTLFIVYGNHLGPNNVTDGAVWKLAPHIDRWTNITPVAPSAATRDTFGYAGLAVDPRRPGLVLVSTLDRWKQGDEIFRSTDAGTTWQPLLATATWDYSSAPYTAALKPHWIGSVALDPFGAERAWFVTGYGVWATERADAVDQGKSTPWVFLDRGLEETVPLALVSPSAGAPLVSAIGDIAGFRHDTFDRSPAAGAHQPSHGSNSSLAGAAAQPLKFVRTHSGPTHGAISVDGGASWRNFAAAPPTAARGPGKIALSADGRRLVWLPKGSAPYFSSDDGATWHESQGGPVSSNKFEPDWPVADGAVSEAFYIYHRACGRVFASRDGGTTFQSSAELPPGGGMMNTPPGIAGEIWAPTPEGLFRSVDGARHFAKVPGLDGATQLGFGRAAPGRKEPAVFVHGRIASRRGFFRSDDNGASWVSIGDAQHQFGWIHALTGDPRVFGRVYLATGGRGIVWGEPAEK